MGNRCIETWNAEAAECGPGCFCAEATHGNRIVFLNLTLLLSGMLPLNLYVREATLYEARRGGLTGRWGSEGGVDIFRAIPTIVKQLNNRIK